MPAGTPSCGEAACGIGFEVEVAVASRHLQEQLHAAVFPAAAAIGKVLHPEVESAHAPVYQKGILRAGYSAGAQGGIRVLRGPVYGIYAEGGAACLKGGVEVAVFQILQEGNVKGLHAIRGFRVF